MEETVQNQEAQSKRNLGSIFDGEMKNKTWFKIKSQHQKTNGYLILFLKFFLPKLFLCLINKKSLLHFLFFSLSTVGLAQSAPKLSLMSLVSHKKTIWYVSNCQIFEYYVVFILIFFQCTKLRQPTGQRQLLENK